MEKQILSLALGILGPLGLLTLLIMSTMITRHYWRSRIGSFRWHVRNVRLKQLSALACLFCVAMAASYAVLQEVWAIVYLIIAFKTGTWWFRFSISQRS